MAQIIKTTDKPKQRTLIIGPPKTVKTPLALAHTMMGKGKVIYVAVDPGSEYLLSLPDEWRERIVVVKPDVGGDMLLDTMNIAGYDWLKDYPDATDLVWDSGSHTAESLLQYIADSEFFSSSKTGDKHVSIGEPGSPHKMNIPVQGDYLAIKGIIERWTTLLFRQPLDLFVITHVDTDDKPGPGKRTRGGPALVGKALIQDFPRYFNAVLRTHKTMEMVDGVQVPQLYVYTEGDDFWIGGVRHKPKGGSSENPMPVVQLGRDTDSLVRFWRKFEEVYLGA